MIPDTLDLFGEVISRKNKSTLQSSIGSRNNNVGLDFYPTPPIATIELLERETFTGGIWECACGDGSMSKVLEDYDYPVRSTDLVYHGYGEESSLNFLRSTERADNIITNPPFKKANQFIAKALNKADHQVALLMRLNYVSSDARMKFYKSNKVFPFRKLYVFSYRLPFKGSGNMMDFAWFIWDKSYKGEPTIDWI